VLLVAGGPALVAAGRRVFRTPGWPFLVGAAAGVVLVLATGVGRADPGGALLPYVPWLVTAAVPARGGRPPVRATGGGAAGIVLARLLYPW
jgi:methylthioxylose transferase